MCTYSIQGDAIAEGDEPVKYLVCRRLEGLRWNAPGFSKKRHFKENLYYNGSVDPPSRLDDSKPVPFYVHTLQKGAQLY